MRIMQKAKDKQIDLRIRCSSETRHYFRQFVVEQDFPNYEKALRHLLDYYYGKISKAPVTTH